MKYEPRWHVVLYQPQIPQNTGNIGRTCMAVGAKLWLVRPLGFQINEKRLRRAGMDYWQHLEWEAVDSWSELQSRLSSSRFWYFTKTATRRYTHPQFQLGDVLVFGSESDGLPPSLLAIDPQHNLRIPMREPARSLNLASSVAVAAYELQRQAEGWGESKE